MSLFAVVAANWHCSLVPSSWGADDQPSSASQIFHFDIDNPQRVALMSRANDIGKLESSRPDVESSPHYIPGDELFLETHNSIQAKGLLGGCYNTMTTEEYSVN